MYDENETAHTFTPSANRNLISYGAQVIGEITDEIGLEVEAISGSYQDTSLAGIVSDRIYRMSYSIMPFWAPTSIDFLKKYTFYFRYEGSKADLNPDSTQTYRGRVHTMVPGLNYEFTSAGTSRLVLKAEVFHVDATENTYYAEKAGDISKDLQFTELRLSMAASF
jgi:hypothetical protein